MNEYYIMLSITVMKFISNNNQRIYQVQQQQKTGTVTTTSVKVTLLVLSETDMKAYLFGRRGVRLSYK